MRSNTSTIFQPHSIFVSHKNLIGALALNAPVPRRPAAQSSRLMTGWLSPKPLTFLFTVPMLLGLNCVATAGDIPGFPYVRWLEGAGTNFVNGISGDGSVAVGYSISSNGPRPFRWEAATGTLRYIDGGIEANGGRPEKTNVDGSVIVGTSSSDQAFRWTARTGMRTLGTLQGIGKSSATGVSGDGSIIIGVSENADVQRAFRWSAATGVMTAIDMPADVTSSVANDVSLDGRVVVGEYFTAANVHAFRWTATDGAVDIGTLPGSYGARALATNTDGTIVAGVSRFVVQVPIEVLEDRAGKFDGTDIKDGPVNPDVKMFIDEWHAFRWNAATGSMQPLEVIPNGSGSIPYAMSADGSVIVGNWQSASGQRGFRWTEPGGMLSVEDWLRNNGVPIASDFTSTATDVSADGNIVVGRTRNNTSYIARIVLAVSATADPRTNLDNVDTVTPADPRSSGRQPRGIDPTNRAVTSTTPSASSGTTSSSPSSTSSASASPSGSSNTSTSPATTTSGAASTPTASSVSSPGSAAKTGHSILPARSGIIDLDQYAGTIAARPNAGVGLNIANIVLDGAHGMPMRSLLEPGRQSFSIVSDVGHNDGRDAAGAFGIADIGYGFGLDGGATARIAFGGLYDQRDINTGGDFIHSGFYIAPEISLPLTDGLYATIGGYYAPGRMSIERGYLNGGTMDYSRGETDLNVWAAKLRFDWLDALTIGEWNLTPYAGVTYAKAEMGAYAETGGAFPAGFDASGEQSTIIRAGLDGVTNFSDSIRFLARAEAAYRLEKKTATTTGTIDDLMGFSFAGQDIDRFWLRGGLGAEFDIAGGTASLNVNVTTEGNDPGLWVRAGWKITF
ncbi:hypothetical protein EN41_15495 [Agrobacterium tumefaciens]|uniref:Autotransporter domain-containing protein n=3 Tax=Agrobacterium fabrum TaxID=1176649 RepID=Q7D0P8_AGRFC|nr:autotransporter domain-containing protein [Agrobacterium fabrum]AAK86587.2 conserved hypothetical protein [Agrobacterium fabrum str. C58]KEY55183.1 hypothetical protein EN41_15495 [Agrobacterium tumefaciens]KJX89191.1 Extracellular serine protease [Agrobacterium tumefaciens]NMV68539.1 autotransporter domain-containing protein [Agrobacterium fabrum]QQN06155.1 autotransporter domain-containing protein [Agrobacterium fabrum]